MSDNSGGQSPVSFPTKRRTLMGALAAGVGLSAITRAGAQQDDEESADLSEVEGVEEEEQNLIAALSPVDDAAQEAEPGMDDEPTMDDEPGTEDDGVGTDDGNETDATDDGNETDATDDGVGTGDGNETAVGQDDTEMETDGENETETTEQEDSPGQAADGSSAQATDTATSGVGAFHLRAPGEDTDLVWHLLIEELEGVTAAHIHEGEAGEDGPVAVPLVEYEGFGEEMEEEPGAETDDENETDVGQDDAEMETDGENETDVGQDDAEMETDGENETETTDQEEPTMEADGGQMQGEDAPLLEAGTFSREPNVEEPEAGGAETGSTEHEVEDDTIDDVLENPSEYYVNVHTEDQPGGAIRGQLRAEGEIPEEAEEPALGEEDDTTVGDDTEDNETETEDDTTVGDDTEDNETETEDDTTIGDDAEDNETETEDDTTIGGDPEDNETDTIGNETDTGDTETDTEDDDGDDDDGGIFD